MDEIVLNERFKYLERRKKRWRRDSGATFVSAHTNYVRETIERESFPLHEWKLTFNAPPRALAAPENNFS